MTTSPEPIVAPQAGQARRGVRRNILVSLVLCGAVVGLAIWQRHRLADMPGILTDANWAWIGAAIAVEGASIASLARLHRRLLDVDGKRHRLGPILATAYAGNAISVSLPLVGSTASALFAYKRYLHIGADKAVAAWALAVSGVYSTIAFVGLSAVGALVSGSVGLAIAGLLTLCTGVVPVVILLASLHHPRVQPLVKGLLTGIFRMSRRLISKPAGDPVVSAGRAVDQVAGLRLGRRNAVMAARFALLNWTADFACLLCALQAVGATVPWHGVLLAWAAGAGASSIGLTPGGLGVVEAALSVALVAAGLPTGVAVSAVLLYRFVQLWLVLAAGTVTLMVIRARDRRLGTTFAGETGIAPEPVPSLLTAAPNHLYPVPPIRRQGRDPDRSAPAGRGTGPGSRALHNDRSVRT